MSGLKEDFNRRYFDASFTGNVHKFEKFWLRKLENIVSIFVDNLEMFLLGKYFNN